MDNYSNKPLLTIGIPTYNRATFLNKSLGSMCLECGNNKNVEILVCDNCSSDETETVVNKYMKVYKNVRYIKQSENLGFDRNLKSIFDLASGRYIKPHGDDDYLIPGGVNSIMSIISEDKPIDLYFIHCSLGKRTVYDSGYNSYINTLRKSNGITFLTSIIISKNAYEQINNKEKYLGSDIYQLYLEMEVLKFNPQYCLIGGLIDRGSGAAPRRFYNIGHVFVKSYLDILYDYIEVGLSIETIKEEKKHLLGIIKALAKVSNEYGNSISSKNLDEIFIKYYSDEAYFQGELMNIRNIIK